MFNFAIGKDELQAIIEGMSDLDFARFLYCQEMAGTYLAVGKFESMLISSMLMCDHIRVQKTLGPDQAAWDRLLTKKKRLEGETLGTLIKILERHSINSADITYLRWIKNKRDYFVHRLFFEAGLPGDLDAEDCHHMRRRLLAIQLWLERGAAKIWPIFERAGLMELNHFSDGSILAIPAGFYDLLEDDISETPSHNGAPI